MTDAISTTGLGRSYGATVALHPLSMKVAKGEVFGFLGHDGAGKTTTIQPLITLARPTTGRTSVAGHDILTDAMTVRRGIGYARGNLRLYDTFTTGENLLFSACPSAVDDPTDRVADTLDFLGITDLAARRVGEFSKGIRQRLGLTHPGHPRQW